MIAQSCPTLCDPVDYTVHGILQARILEWVAFPFSRDLAIPGIKPRSLALQADSLLAEPQGKPIAYAQLFGQDSYLPGSELGVVNTEQREMFSGMNSNKQTSAKNPPSVWVFVQNSRLYKNLT